MGTSQGKMGKSPQEIIAEYFSEFSNSVYNLESISQNDYSERVKEITDFAKKVGIVGGFVVFANNMTGGFDVILPPDTNNDGNNNSDSLGFAIPWNEEKFNIKEGVGNRINFINKLIQTTQENKTFITSNIFEYPQYFLHLPPKNSYYRLLPSENYINEILLGGQEYLVCSVGEVLFFQYIWRYLYNINFQNGNIHENSNLFERKLESLLNEYQIKPNTDLKTEWINLSIFPDSLIEDSLLPVEDDNDSIVYCIYNLYHLLLYISELNIKNTTRYNILIKGLKDDIELIIAQSFNTSRADFISTVCQKFILISKKIEIIHESIVKISDRVLDQIVREDAWPYMSNLFSNEELSNKYLNRLLALHAVSRFPIIPSYYINYCSNGAVVHDYVVYPLLDSEEYKINSTNFKNSSATVIEIKKVALLVNFVEPIWTNSSFIKSGVRLLSETEETIKGFKLNQIFFSTASRHLIDNKFYGNYFRKFIIAEQLNSAIAKIFARNFAHNIGSHVAMYATNKAVKKRIKEESMYPTINIIEDKYQSWLDYTTEKFDNFQIARNEFMADYNLPPKNVYFYHQVILPFVENTLIMDSIAFGENIKYMPNKKKEIRNRLKIIVKYNSDDINAKYYELDPEGGAVTYPGNFPYFVEPKKPEMNSENESEKSRITLEDAFNIKTINDDFEVCLSSEHSIYSILENFIRNSAKHQTKELNPEVKDVKPDLEVTIDVNDTVDPNFYDLLIYDNVSKIPADTLRTLQEGIDEDLVGFDGELARKGLGVADMKINAYLLQSLGQIDEEKLKKAITIKYCEVDECLEPTFRQEAKKEELAKLTDKEARYRFAYHLKLTKPKKILWLKSGVSGDEVNRLQKQGVIIESDTSRLLNYESYNFDKPLAAYTFAILEKDLIQNLVENSEDSLNALLFNLPFRVLINCKEKDIRDERIKVLYKNRRVQTVSDDFPLSHSLNCHDLLKNCWENWLKRWLTNDEAKRGVGHDKAHIYLYLDNKVAAQRWGEITFDKNSSIKFTALDAVESDTIKAENDDYLIFYDRHGKGYKKVDNKNFTFKEQVSYFKRISYFQFDGASTDFVQFFYPPKTAIEKHLLLYQAAEAGLMNILILDERIAELLTEAEGEGNVSMIAKNNSFPAKPSKTYEGDYADLFNLSKLFVISRYDNKISPIPNFELTVEKDIVSLSPPSYLEGANLKYDAFIIHRTFLSKIFENQNALGGQPNRIMDEMTSKFTRIIVVSGGGYPHSLPKEVRVHFQPFESLRKNFRKYPSKLSLIQLL